jgi:hypothetical protein
MHWRPTTWDHDNIRDTVQARALKNSQSVRFVPALPVGPYHSTHVMMM